MQLKKISAVLGALALGASTLVCAQPRDNRDNRDGPGQPQQQDRDGRPGAPARGNANGGPGNGAGPDHRFHSGDRLPAEYRSRQYVVDDWRSHRLSAPPRGYQWVQVGGDYVLAAIATGIITSLILNQ